MADRIESSLARSRREGTSTGLLFVDLDRFKRVNDTLGHTGGDELLQRVGERLSAMGDSRITAGRYSGDEFLLLVEDLPFDAEEAAGAVRELGEAVLEALHEPFSVARALFEVTASIGASIFPRDATGNPDLIEHADQAMYVAKRGGRARMALFDTPEAHSVIELETTLRARRALQRDEFELVYQPVIEIADGHCLGGLEALLRWQDPDRGLLVPDVFLPFIEHSPLFEEIGEWVFARVCRQLVEWSRRDFSPRISFNIPARQLQRTGFADYLVATAHEANADPTRLALEITETSPVALEDVHPTLLALREAGFALSLDDFGTGYSSLARLHAMPFTLLKTDRTFMAGIPGDAVAEELLEGIIALGNTLGLKVIVEGVESAAQERELLRIGARVAQGFHLGAPAPPEEIELRWGPSSVEIGSA